MRNAMLVMLAAVVCGCSHTVTVQVPPRVDLKPYTTLGIIDFGTNGERGSAAQATRRFQEQVQEAQPGTRFIELGNREAVLAAVGAREIDPAALRKIGEKYGVAAVFLGDVVYSEPKTDIKVSDIYKLEGAMRSEVRGDISSRLLETGSGASVWTRTAWAKRQLGNLSVSAERGVSGGLSQNNPREEMVPALVYQITHDFRPTTARQSAP
jgi:hypothetical protein